MKLSPAKPIARPIPPDHRRPDGRALLWTRHVNDYDPLCPQAPLPVTPDQAAHDMRA